MFVNGDAVRKAAGLVLFIMCVFVSKYLAEAEREGCYLSCGMLRQKAGLVGKIAAHFGISLHLLRAGVD